MYNYANKINLAINQDRTEVILSFIQESPKFTTTEVDDNGNYRVDTNLQAETIANIVVTKSFAKELVALITEMLEEN